MAKVREKTENEVSWVDIHNDSLMVKLGIRQPNLEPRDPSVWTKTPKEKKAVRKMKRSVKDSWISGGLVQKKSIPVYGKLIVNVMKNDKFKIPGTYHIKTTFSHNCGQADIPFILSKYSYTNNNGETKSLVISYKWLGKEYKNGEIPFWDYRKNSRSDR